MKFKKQLLSIAAATALLGGSTALFGAGLSSIANPGIVGEPTALTITRSHDDTNNLDANTSLVTFTLNPEKWDLSSTPWDSDTVFNGENTNANGNDVATVTLKNGLVLKITDAGTGGTIEDVLTTASGTFKWDKTTGTFTLTKKGAGSATASGNDDKIELFIPASFGIKPLSGLTTNSNDEISSISATTHGGKTPTATNTNADIVSSAKGSVSLEFNGDANKTYGAASSYKIKIKPPSNKSVFAANDAELNIRIEGIKTSGTAVLADATAATSDGTTVVVDGHSLENGILKIVRQGNAVGNGKELIVTVNIDALGSNDGNATFLNPIYAKKDDLRVSVLSGGSHDVRAVTTSFKDQELESAIDTSSSKKPTVGLLFGDKDKTAKVGQTGDVELNFTTQSTIAANQNFVLSYPRTVEIDRMVTEASGGATVKIGDGSFGRVGDFGIGTKNKAYLKIKSTGTIGKGEKVTIRIPKVKFLDEKIGDFKIDVFDSTSGSVSGNTITAIAGSADTAISGAGSKLHPTVTFTAKDIVQDPKRTPAKLMASYDGIEVIGSRKDGVNGVYKIVVDRDGIDRGTNSKNARSYTLKIKSLIPDTSFKLDRKLENFNIANDNFFIIGGEKVSYKRTTTIEELISKLNSLKGFSSSFEAGDSNNGKIILTKKFAAGKDGSFEIAEPGNANFMEYIFNIVNTDHAFKFNSETMIEDITRAKTDDKVKTATPTIYAERTYDTGKSKAPSLQVWFKPTDGDEGDNTKAWASDANGDIKDKAALHFNPSTGKYDSITSSALGFEIKVKGDKTSFVSDSDSTYTIMAKDGKFISNLDISSDTPNDTVALVTSDGNTIDTKSKSLKASTSDSDRKNLYIKVSPNSAPKNIGKVKVTLPEGFKKGEGEVKLEDASGNNLISSTKASRSGMEFYNLGRDDGTNSAANAAPFYITIPKVSFDPTKIKADDYSVKVQFAQIGGGSWVEAKKKDDLKFKVVSDGKVDDIMAETPEYAKAGTKVKLKTYLLDKYDNKIMEEAKETVGQGKVVYTVKSGSATLGTKEKTSYKTSYLVTKEGTTSIPEVLLNTSKTEENISLHIAYMKDGSDKVFKDQNVSISTVGVEGPAKFSYKAGQDKDKKDITSVNVGKAFTFDIGFEDSNGKSTAYASDAPTVEFKVNDVAFSGEISRIGIKIVNGANVNTDEIEVAEDLINGENFKGFKAGQKVYVVYESTAGKGWDKAESSVIKEVKSTFSPTTGVITGQTIILEEISNSRDRKGYISSAIFKIDKKYLKHKEGSEEGIFEYKIEDSSYKNTLSFQSHIAGTYNLELKDRTGRLVTSTKSIKPFIKVQTADDAKASKFIVEATDKKALANDKDALVYTISLTDNAGNKLTNVTDQNFEVTVKKGLLLDDQGAKKSTIMVKALKGVATVKVVSDVSLDGVELTVKHKPTADQDEYTQIKVKAAGKFVNNNAKVVSKTGITTSKVITLQLTDTTGADANIDLADVKITSGDGGSAWTRGYEKISTNKTSFKAGKLVLELQSSKKEKITFKIEAPGLADDLNLEIDFSKSITVEEYKANEKANVGGSDTLNIKGVDLSNVQKDTASNVDVNGNTIMIDASKKSITFGTAETSAPIELETNFKLKFK